MKKFLGSFIILIIFFLPGTLYAQEPASYSEAFLQYNLRMEDYSKAREAYILRRSQYIKFKSLQSENDARKATAAFLQARDDVVIAYIKTLQKRMAESKGISDPDRSLFNGELNDEVFFFTDHKEKIPSAGTLQDLVEDSAKAEVQYKKDVDNLFYRVLFIISNGKVNDLKDRLNEGLAGIKTKVDTIRAETRPEYMFNINKMQAIDRFVFESEKKLERANDKQQEATTKETLEQFNSEEYNLRLGVLDEGRLLLKEASSYLREILSEMKTKE